MINNDYELPLGTYEFIEFLHEQYPSRCLRLDEDITAHHRYAAIREFIDELKIIKSEHEEGYDDSGDD